MPSKRKLWLKGRRSSAKAQKQDPAYASDKAKDQRRKKHPSRYQQRLRRRDAAQRVR